MCTPSLASAILILHVCGYLNPTGTYDSAVEPCPHEHKSVEVRRNVWVKDCGVPCRDTYYHTWDTRRGTKPFSVSEHVPVELHFRSACCRRSAVRPLGTLFRYLSRRRRASNSAIEDTMVRSSHRNHSTPHTIHATIEVL